MKIRLKNSKGSKGVDLINKCFKCKFTIRIVNILFFLPITVVFKLNSLTWPEGL